MSDRINDEFNRLKEKAMRYELLFELSDDAILVIENEKFVDCNQAVIKMLGYKHKSELLNTHPSELSPKHQPDGQLSYVKAEKMIATAIEKGSHHFEWIHTRANGEDFPVEVWLSTVKHNDKLMLNTIWRDLTDTKKKEEKIKSALREKDALLKEIHHRVKNNLQVITSLISLQSGLIQDTRYKAFFKQSQLRIHSMSIIHEMLYQTDDISNVNYNDYLKDLISSILFSMKGSNHKITTRVAATDMLLNIDTAVPLGLLITEIITNSIKYAFDETSDPVITVNIEKLPDHRYKMKIGDNGKGISPDITQESTPSLGLKLIHNLTLQLNGRLERDPSTRGTNYIIEFEDIKEHP